MSYQSSRATSTLTVGKKFLQNLSKVVNTTMNRANVKFSGAREKGAMTFVECLGVSLEDTMEGSSWRES